jgi:hypothetical protein
VGNRALQRMAARMAQRAGIDGEQPVTASFGFSSLPAAIIVSVLDELPYVGLVLTFVTFGIHRLVLVTDQNTYVFRGRPFHRPGAVLATVPVGPGSVTRTRGKLTFADGTIVWHSPLLGGRAKRVAAAATGS